VIPPLQDNWRFTVILGGRASKSCNTDRPARASQHNEIAPADLDGYRYRSHSHGTRPAPSILDEWSAHQKGLLP
jgi:hypothetical protein